MSFDYEKTGERKIKSELTRDLRNANWTFFMACFEKINWVIVTEQWKSHHATFMPFSEISIKAKFDLRFSTLYRFKKEYVHRFRENNLSSSKELSHRDGLWEILKFALLKFSYLYWHWSFFICTKLYIPSTLNIAILQWHTHLNVCAVK